MVTCISQTEELVVRRGSLGTGPGSWAAAHLRSCGRQPHRSPLLVAQQSAPLALSPPASLFLWSSSPPCNLDSGGVCSPSLCSILLQAAAILTRGGGCPPFLCSVFLLRAAAMTYSWTTLGFFFETLMKLSSSLENNRGSFPELLSNMTKTK